MKNLFTTFFTILTIAALVSCGDDDSTGCTQADFVGTYTLAESATCSADPTLSAPDSFFLTAGPTEDTVLENGEADLQLPIVNCTAQDEFVSYTLDGNIMTTRIGDCEWSYTKN